MFNSHRFQRRVYNPFYRPQRHHDRLVERYNKELEIYRRKQSEEIALQFVSIARMVEPLNTPNSPLKPILTDLGQTLRDFHEGLVDDVNEIEYGDHSLLEAAKRLTKTVEVVIDPLQSIETKNYAITKYKEELPNCKSMRANGLVRACLGALASFVVAFACILAIGTVSALVLSLPVSLAVGALIFTGVVINETCNPDESGIKIGEQLKSLAAADNRLFRAVKPQEPCVEAAPPVSLNL